MVDPERHVFVSMVARDPFCSEASARGAIFHPIGANTIAGGIMIFGNLPDMSVVCFLSRFAEIASYALWV